MPPSAWKEDELWEAVSNRDIAAVKTALEKGANASCIAPDGWVRDEVSGKGGKSVLHHAAYVGDLAVFTELVEQGGADMTKRRQRNWASFRGNTPFHTAAFYGRQSIVEYCIDSGADVNMQGEQGYTCLHLAAKHGYPKLVEYLLSVGARADMITKDEKTCWQLAKTEEIRELLLRHNKTSVVMHKDLPTLPQAASAQYLQNGWTKGDTDTFRNPAPRAIVPLGTLKDPTKDEDPLRGRAARFLPSRERDVDETEVRIGKENVNFRRDRMMPAPLHMQQQQQQQQQQYKAAQSQHSMHQQGQQQPSQYVSDQEYEQRFASRHHPQARADQEYAYESELAPQGYPQQQQQQRQQQQQQHTQHMQQQQASTRSDVGAGRREQQAQATFGNSMIQGNGVPRGNVMLAGSGIAGGNGMMMSEARPSGVRGEWGGSADYNEDARWEDDETAYPPKKSTGLEALSDEELMARLEQARASRFAQVSAAAVGMQRTEQDNAATHYGDYYGWEKEQDTAQQPSKPNDDEGFKQASSVGGARGKDVSRLNAEMEAFVAERMREHELAERQREHIHNDQKAQALAHARSVQLGTSDKLTNARTTQFGGAGVEPRRGMGKGETMQSDKDPLYAEAVKKERAAMVALMDAKRKIGNFYAQSAAKNMIDPPSSAGSSRGMQAAGLRVTDKGGSYKDKAVDTDSGEGFYVAKKTTGNVLMHDAMYTKPAVDPNLPRGGVHACVKSTRPW